MSKILLLFAHPRFENSKVNKALVAKIQEVEHVTFRDLYEEYPLYNIDVEYEKSLLLSHDIIVWHHPLYWYSCPPLLKQWIDVVLEYNWAYGPEGHALDGKKVMTTITVGGSRKVYSSEGYNSYPINDFLRPFKQTAKLCGMQYLPPFAVMGTHRLNSDDLDKYCISYRELLTLLKDDKLGAATESLELMNDLPELSKI